MTRLGRLLLIGWVAIAVWLSERWASMLPAVLGVLIGVWLSRLQQAHYTKHRKGLPPFELISLLVILLCVASLVYVYLMFLLLGPSQDPARFSIGLGLGAVSLVCLLVGLGTIWQRKLRLPNWCLRCWQWLIQEH